MDQGARHIMVDKRARLSVVYQGAGHSVVDQGARHSVVYQPARQSAVDQGDRHSTLSFFYKKHLLWLRLKFS